MKLKLYNCAYSLKLCEIEVNLVYLCGFQTVDSNTGLNLMS